MSAIKYPVSLPFFPPEEIDRVLGEIRPILQGLAVLSMGPRVKEFESSFARSVDAPYAVATNSCSAALEIALRIAGIGAGDEVIVPTETFIATGAAVVREGGRVVFADIDPETFCLTAAETERRLTSRTRAVIVVHMAGLVTPEILKIRDLCRKKGIFLIEDAAHAPGAAFQGQKAGSFGDVACFSFYPTKILTTGEGGMLVTANENIFRKADGLRNRGRDTTQSQELYSEAGTNNRITEIQAILGLSQLRQLDRFLEKRREIARIYAESLAEESKKGVLCPLPVPTGCDHSYWRYIVRTSERLDRNRLKERLEVDGVAIDWPYDPPLHLQPLFRRLNGNKEGLLPATEKALRHFVSLPIHVGMKPNDARFIAQALKKAAGDLLG